MSAVLRYATWSKKNNFVINNDHPSNLNVAQYQSWILKSKTSTAFGMIIRDIRKVCSQQTLDMYIPLQCIIGRTMRTMAHQLAKMLLSTNVDNHGRIMKYVLCVDYTTEYRRDLAGLLTSVRNLNKADNISIYSSVARRNARDAKGYDSEEEYYADEIQKAQRVIDLTTEDDDQKLLYHVSSASNQETIYANDQKPNAPEALMREQHDDWYSDTDKQSKQSEDSDNDISSRLRSRSSTIYGMASYDDTFSHPNNGSAIGLTGLNGGKPSSQVTLIGLSLLKDKNGARRAGMGQFCGRKMIKERKVFTMYRGIAIADHAEAKRRSDYSDYIFGLVDAIDPKSCTARYSNDCMDDKWYNARIIYVEGETQYEVRATKDIMPYDEIYIDFGVYWTAAKLSQHPWLIEQHEQLMQSRIEDPNIYVMSQGKKISNAYYDNGASVTASPNLHELTDVVEIKPFSIGGIAGNIIATHKGRLPYLPRAMSRCYYAKDLQVTLVSLGYINVKGGSYFSKGFRKGKTSKLTIWDENDKVIATSMMTSNRLFPVKIGSINPSTWPKAFMLPYESNYGHEDMSDNELCSHGTLLQTENKKTMHVEQVLKYTQPTSTASMESSEKYKVLSKPSLEQPSAPDSDKEGGKSQQLVNKRAYQADQSISTASMENSEKYNVLSKPSLEQQSAPDSDKEGGKSQQLVNKRAYKEISQADQSTSTASMERSEKHNVLPKPSLEQPSTLDSDDEGGKSEQLLRKRAYTKFNQTDKVGHLNREERQRAAEAEELHVCSCHPSDEALCASLDNGLVPGSRLTSRDVRNNRLLRGACPQCDQGKNRKYPMKPSNAPPAPSIGHTLCIDLDILPSESPNGNKQQLTCVDEKTGRVDIAGAKIKSTVDLFSVVWEIVSRYNMLGFVVHEVHVDIEKALVSLTKRLSAAGIKVIASPAEQHQQRVERYIQTVNNRTTAVLEGLDFVLPNKYLLQARFNTAVEMNKMQNSRCSPSTPYLLTEQKHPSSHIEVPLLRFGATAMVRMGVNKRVSIARGSKIPVKNTSKSELGVCLGSNPLYSGQYMFAIKNGAVVPRKRFKVVACEPFDWPRQMPIKAKIMPLLPIPSDCEQQLPATVNSLMQQLKVPYLSICT